MNKLIMDAVPYALPRQFKACSDDQCLCDPPVVKAIMATETCYFNTLIAENRVMPDPLAANQVVITSAYKSSYRVRKSLKIMADYTTACAAANVTKPPVAANMALATPVGWDGPFSDNIGTGATVVALIAAIVLGTGAITIVNTM